MRKTCCLFLLRHMRRFHQILTNEQRQKGATTFITGLNKKGNPPIYTNTTQRTVSSSTGRSFVPGISTLVGVADLKLWGPLWKHTCASFPMPFVDGERGLRKSYLLSSETLISWLTLTEQNAVLKYPSRFLHAAWGTLCSVVRSSPPCPLALDLQYPLLLAIPLSAQLYPVPGPAILHRYPSTPNSLTAQDMEINSIFQWND